MCQLKDNGWIINDVSTRRPDLEEWMDHGGVPLHADGDGEVDGARQPYLGQRQQHRHQVGVPRLTPDAAKYKGIANILITRSVTQCKQLVFRTGEWPLVCRLSRIWPATASGSGNISS